MRQIRLDDLYHMVANIYYEQNSLRSTAATYAHFVEVCGMLAVHDRKKKKSGIIVETALCKALGWYFPLLAKLKVSSVEELIFRKYPWVCPYCREAPHNDRNCKLVRGTEQTVNHDLVRKFYTTNTHRRPVTLNEWQHMFQTIYPRDTEDRGRSTIGLFEEIGELGEAVRVFDRHPKYFAGEAADVFSYLMGIAMPSFRSSKAKAEHAVGKLSAIGTARHGNNHDSRIHSLGTARGYQQSLQQFNDWLSETRQGDIASVTHEQAVQYLDMRSGEVRQKMLDMDRQAIQAALGEKLPVIKSELETILTTRSYTHEQMQLVMAAQSERNRFSTLVAREAGLRAHELLTLQPSDKRPASTHRTWRGDRFTGGDRNMIIWTVVGKGGLCREVALSKEVSEALEARRLAAPMTVKDRGILYQQHYDIAGGRNWSQSFSSASKRALGWSQGGHGGCRHSYAQERMEKLQANGYSLDDAKEIVSQELGHFRRDVVDAYLR